MPPVEHDAALHIDRLLSLLLKYEERFLSALALFDCCESEMGRQFSFAASRMHLDKKGGGATSVPEVETTVEWMTMAARDGALTIYHFGNTLEAIRRALPSCPTINSGVDHQILRSASKYFRKEFPRYEAIRHVVSHAADFTATQADREVHTHKGGPIKAGKGSIEYSKGMDRFFSDNLANRTYFVSYEGKAHSYEIDHETAGKLFLSRLRVYSALGRSSRLKPAR
jgi:hypothetical protein